MSVKFSKRFVKQFDAVPTAIKQLFDNKLQIFLLNKFDLTLNNHQLKGKMKGLRSINLGGDWRVIFEEAQNGDITFKLIGTHSQLYN